MTDAFFPPESHGSHAVLLYKAVMWLGAICLEEGWAEAGVGGVFFAVFADHQVALTLQVSFIPSLPTHLSPEIWSTK